MSETTQLQEAVEKLRKEEQRLIGELEELKARLKTVARELKRLRVALSALGVATNGSPGLSGLKPSLTDAQALVWVTECLRASGTLAVEGLQNGLLEHAKASGLSGTGIHLVLRRVLKDARFVETTGGYTIRSTLRPSA